MLGRQLLLHQVAGLHHGSEGLIFTAQRLGHLGLGQGLGRGLQALLGLFEQRRGGGSLGRLVPWLRPG